MSLLYLDVRVEALSQRKLAINVVYQNPYVASRLPFQAKNGVLLTKFQSGRVSAGFAGGRPVIALRGHECPLPNWRDGAVAEVPDAVATARKVREAVAELRRDLQRRRA